MSEPTNHLHGRLGVFCGGEWIPMNEAPEKWNHDIEEVVGTCADTKRCKEMPSDEFDVIVIGAGCVGCSVARELSKFSLKVLVVEKADDVTQGATKGNSGIVHAGYDDEPGIKDEEHNIHESFV
jgi:glycerol-3-phosphate dehydrogenase